MKRIFLFIVIGLFVFGACKKDVELLHEEPIDTTEKEIVIENGAIKAEFSVSDTKKIYFSQGNLQYNASTNTWRFAENQYDRIGLENSKISSTYSGWIDLFGWGMSGYNDKYPYLATEKPTDYVDDRNSIARTNYDWGIYNKISNGGNAAGLWRTLTISEWAYLIYYRDKSSSETGKGWAKVNGINGLILLPDDWILPQGLTFVEGGYYSDTLYNIYSITDWKKMESHGAVFLPAAGKRYGTTVEGVKNTGHYWSSIGYDGFGANFCGLNVHYEGTAGCSRYAGLSVRLVQDVENSKEIIELPTVFTGIVYNVSYTSTTITGTVSSDGGSDITERGFCWNTTGNPTISDNKKVDDCDIGNFSASIVDLEEGTTYYARAYATNSKGTAYGEVISFTTKLVDIIDGTIQAEFSVSATKKIYFSQGNLQYQASTNTWRFAEHQYDIIGEDNQYISATYSGWIDLFGCGTSGYKNIFPYLTSERVADYGDGNDIAGTNYDWGVYNKISNGGNQVGLWRTLTFSEWYYLIHNRTNASALCGLATVNGEKGCMFLPDKWTNPAGITFKCESNDYSENIYTTSEWEKMENNGAIFLPATGRRWKTQIDDFSNGHYWSSSSYDNGRGNYLYITFKSITIPYGSYATGKAVRLVKDVK